MERDFGEFTLCNVNARADITAEVVVRIKTRDTVVDDPAKFTVIAAQAIFHFKFHTRVESAGVDGEAAIEIVGVHARSPAFAQFLLDRASREIEPATIEKSAEFVGARHPDECWGRVRHEAKALFAFAENRFLSFAFLDKNGENHERNRGAPEKELEVYDFVDGIEFRKWTAAVEGSPDGEERHNAGGSAGSCGTKAKCSPKEERDERIQKRRSDGRSAGDMHDEHRITEGGEGGEERGSFESKMFARAEPIATERDPTENGGSDGKEGQALGKKVGADGDPAAAVQGLRTDDARKHGAEKNGEQAIRGERFEAVETRRLAEEMADAQGCDKHFDHVRDEEPCHGGGINADLPVVKLETDEAGNDKSRPQFARRDEENRHEGGTTGPERPEGLRTTDDQGAAEESGEITDHRNGKNEERRTPAIDAGGGHILPILGGGMAGSKGKPVWRAERRSVKLKDGMWVVCSCRYGPGNNHGIRNLAEFSWGNRCARYECRRVPADSCFGTDPTSFVPSCAGYRG